MQLEIEALSPIRRRVAVNVPLNRVDSAFAKAYNRVAQRASLPGFRQGRVPMSHIRKRFRKQVTGEVTQGLVEAAWQLAIDEHGLSPMGEPELDAGLAEAGKPFIFTITVEVEPSFELQPFDELKVERERWTASSAVVEHELEHLAEEVATFEPVTDRTQAADGDMVVLDYSGRVDGELFDGGTAEDAELELGTGRFIPGFEEQLVGKTVGEATEVRVTFPEDYSAPELAGQEAVFTCTIKDIKAKIIPEIGPALAEQMGEEDIEAVRARVKGRIEERLNHRSADATKDALRAQLGAQYDFELPATLVDSAWETRRNELSAEAMRGGKSAEEAAAAIKDDEERVRAELAAESRAELVLDKIAEQQNVEANEIEVNAFVERLVRSMGPYGGQLRQAYREANRRAALRRRMRQDKTLDFLLTQANVTEIAREVPAHEHEHDDHADGQDPAETEAPQ